MALRKLVVVLGWLMFAPSAFAATYYLEGPPLVEKADATALAASASGQGHEGRVVRRFRQGAGWEYIVLVDGFADEEAARVAAAAIAGSSGRVIGVFESDGGQAKRIGEGAPKGATAAPPPNIDVVAAEPVPPPPTPPKAVKEKRASKAEVIPPAEDAAKIDDPVPGDDPAVATILARAVTAHGGATGGKAAIDAAPSFKFEYRRVVPAGPTVHHVYVERGLDVYLQVDVESGEGVSSRSGIVGGKAWLSKTAAPATIEDLAQTQEVLAKFSPVAVLSFPLGFSEAAVERREFQDMARNGTTTIDGVVCDVLRYAGDRISAPMVLAIDQADGRVRRATFKSDGGDLTHEFSEWHDLGGGVVVPYRVRTWRGSELVDDVQVISLDLTPRIDEAWFRTP